MDSKQGWHVALFCWCNVPLDWIILTLTVWWSEYTLSWYTSASTLPTCSLADNPTRGPSTLSRISPCVLLLIVDELFIFCVGCVFMLHLWTITLTLVFMSELNSESYTSLLHICLSALVVVAQIDWWFQKCLRRYLLARMIQGNINSFLVSSKSLFNLVHCPRICCCTLKYSITSWICSIPVLLDMLILIWFQFLLHLLLRCSLVLLFAIRDSCHTCFKFRSWFCLHAFLSGINFGYLVYPKMTMCITTLMKCCRTTHTLWIRSKGKFSYVLTIPLFSNYFSIRCSWFGNGKLHSIHNIWRSSLWIRIYIWGLVCLSELSIIFVFSTMLELLFPASLVNTPEILLLLSMSLILELLSLVVCCAGDLWFNPLNCFSHWSCTPIFCLEFWSLCCSCENWFCWCFIPSAFAIMFVIWFSFLFDVASTDFLFYSSSFFLIIQ